MKAPASYRVLIYLFPACMDMVVAGVAFVGTLRLAKAGAGGAAAGGVITAWSLAYMVACLILGRVLTPRNAAHFMLAGCGCIALVCLLLLGEAGRMVTYGLFTLAGASAALFFAPFQVFMKAVDQGADLPVRYSTGLYTFSWSLGFAIGPLLAGFLMEVGPSQPGGEPGGWRYAYLLYAVAALLTAAGILVLKHLAAHPAPGPRATPAAAVRDELASLPDLAWLGWLTAGAGMLVISIIRGVFPVRAVNELGMPDRLQGLLFFSLSLAQSLTGFVLIFGRLWMYRATIAALFGFVGVLATLGLGWGRLPLLVCAGGALFGVYSGYFFFYFVFHALTHPSRAPRYIAVNETVVGLTGILGPVLGGAAADAFGFPVAFTASAVLIAGASIFQVAMHRRYPAPSEAPSS